MTHKNSEKILCFDILRAEGFSCSLHVHHGKKIANCDFKIFICFAIKFCNFWSPKPWIRILIDLKC
jgi:hypothetical protein